MRGVSNEILSLISDVTDQEAVVEDVNSYYVKYTSPHDRTTEKCLFCEKTWTKIVTTTKKGHLSNKELAKYSSTTLCPMVPKHVSDFFIDQLNKLKQRKAEQVIRHENMESRLSYEKTNTDFGTKRLRQTTINESIDYEAIALADRKISQFFFAQTIVLTRPNITHIKR